MTTYDPDPLAQARLLASFIEQAQTDPDPSAALHSARNVAAHLLAVLDPEQVFGGDDLPGYFYASADRAYYWDEQGSEDNIVGCVGPFVTEADAYRWARGDRTVRWAAQDDNGEAQWPVRYEQPGDPYYAASR